MTKEEFIRLKPGDLITHIFCAEPVLVVLKISKINANRRQIWFFCPIKNRTEITETPEYCSVVWKRKLV